MRNLQQFLAPFMLFAVSWSYFESITFTCGLRVEAPSGKNGKDWIEFGKWRYQEQSWMSVKKLRLFETRLNFDFQFEV